MWQGCHNTLKDIVVDIRESKKLLYAERVSLENDRQEFKSAIMEDYDKDVYLPRLRYLQQCCEQVGHEPIRSTLSWQNGVFCNICHKRLTRDEMTTV